MVWEIVKWTFLSLVLLSAVLNIRKRGWRPYLLNLLIGIDQFFNSILGGAPDETISSRCARGQKRWYWRLLGGLLNTIQAGHCAVALESEKERLHEPAELR